MPEPRACPYAEAARAVQISLDRAEYTAANVSGFLAGVPEGCCDTRRHAEALIAEWQTIHGDLRFALVLLNFAARHPDQFAKFKFEIENPKSAEGVPPLPTARRVRPMSSFSVAYPAATILAAVKAMAGRA